MNNIKTFLKQCIAEVLVEPAKQFNRLQGKKMRSLIKQCIAEVIIEPVSRKMKVYGNPKRLQMAHLIKECVMEVLKENLLSEIFDPQSQGPNMVEENPYPAMNAKMRMMDEQENKPKEDAWTRYEKGYDAGQVHKRSGIKPEGPMDSVTSVGYHDALKGKAKSSPEVVRKTIKETEPQGRYSKQIGVTPSQSSSDTNIAEYENYLKEASRTQSTSIHWTCPHCGKLTNIDVEIESSSDYIACADCEHCGKEINSPKLDQQIYKTVVDHCSSQQPLP